MDKSSISESFGEQLAAITEGTPYALNGDSDNSSLSNTEGRIRTVMYSLWMDGQAKKFADYLEHKKAVRFADLNDFSYGVTFQEDALYRITSNTESIALKNIDEKESYNKRIQYARNQYNRFQSVCEKLSSNDRELIVNYFEHSHKVAYELLRSTIQCNLLTLEQIYTEANRERESRVIQEARGCTTQEAKAYHAQLDGKQQYFINGRYVYLTPEEHTAYQHKQSNLFEVHGNEERIGAIG